MAIYQPFYSLYDELHRLKVRRATYISCIIEFATLYQITDWNNEVKYYIHSLQQIFFNILLI